MTFPGLPFNRSWHIKLLLLAMLLSGCATQATNEPTPRTSNRVPEQLQPDLYPSGAKAVPEPVVRYGRYTLVSTAPKADQQDLMSQIIDVSIPDSLNPNVRDAMVYVLKRSGYGLCPGSGNINILYTRPLPASQYHLGPMTLRNTLQVLAGPAWQVQVDEVTRGVCFSQRPGYESLGGYLVSPGQTKTSVTATKTHAIPMAEPIRKGDSQ